MAVPAYFHSPGGATFNVAITKLLSLNDFSTCLSSHVTCNDVAAGQPSAANVAPQPPQPALFVTVPPRTQKVVHSEVYLRYV